MNMSLNELLREAFGNALFIFPLEMITIIKNRTSCSSLALVLIEKVLSFRMVYKSFSIFPFNCTFCTQVKTQYGLPEQFETPIVCSITETSVFLYWYAPNPITYGSASKHFEVQCTGDGKSYEQMPTLRVSIEEAMAQGQVMMDTCRLLYTDYVKTKDNLIRSKRFHIHRSKALTVAKAHEAKNEPTSSPAPPAATTPRAKHDEAEDTSVAPNTPAASATTAGDDGGDGANGTGHGAGANVDNSVAASGSVSAMELTPSQAMGDRDTVSSVSFTADPLTDAASMGSAGFLNSPAAVAASAAKTQIPQLSDNMSIDRVKEVR